AGETMPLQPDGTWELDESNPESDDNIVVGSSFITHRIADAHMRNIELAFVEEMHRWRTAVDDVAVEAALAQNDELRVMALLEPPHMFLHNLPLDPVFDEVADYTTRELRLLHDSTLHVLARFDRTHPRARVRRKQQVASLIDNVSESFRQ